jgi:hypothetical protein
MRESQGAIGVQFGIDTSSAYDNVENGSVGYHNLVSAGKDTQGSFSNAQRGVLVGSASIGTATWVPVNRTWLRVKVQCHLP